MRILWDEAAWENYIAGLDLDVKTVRKINALIKECRRTPFTGTGKPQMNRTMRI